MNTKNLKNVLEVIRALVKKNRVAYKDYLGEETVTKVLAECVCEDKENDLTVKDPDFTGFVAGQTYTVTIDGEASDWTAITGGSYTIAGPYVEYVLKNNAPPDDPTGMWEIGTIKYPDETIHILGVGDESYIGKKFVVSQTVTQKKYDVKKLPDELLPDAIVKKIHTHSNKDLLDGLSWEDYSSWYAKSDFDGNYNNLYNKPTLFDGKYSSLTGTPKLFNGKYSSLTGIPDLSIYAKTADIPPYTSMNTLPPYAFAYDSNIQNELIAYEINYLGPCCYLRAANLQSFKSSGIIQIGAMAFYECKNLESLLFNKLNLKIIERYAFYNDVKLFMSELPGPIEKIGEHAFDGCSSISITKLPKTLKEIEDYGFGRCTGITTLTFLSKPEMSFSIFNGCTNLTTINVPWAEGEVANAPWGATNATINYNYVAPTTEETT